MLEHTVTIPAPADAVYALIADVTCWPRIFPPTVHAEVLSTDGDTERIRIWATANDTVKTWTSRRVLDPVARQIEFRQEISAPPVASMGGTWHLAPQPDGTTLVRLTHSFTAVSEDKVPWITSAVDSNSNAELAALRDAFVTPPDLFVVEDTVDITDPGEIYGFLYRAQLWEQRLPHVARVNLTEDTVDIQTLEMDTRAPNGSLHTTKSIRVCLPPNRIVYKQLHLPALLSLHIGQWIISPTTATSSHTVVLRPSAIPTVLGPRATVDDARDFVRNALSTNSMATLKEAARSFR